MFEKQLALVFLWMLEKKVVLSFNKVHATYSSTTQGELTMFTFQLWRELIQMWMLDDILDSFEGDEHWKP